MSRTGLSEGLRWGGVLGALAIVLSILGLTPSLAWIPEVPLLTAAVLLPAAALAMAGFSAGRRSGRASAGVLAGAVAGGIGGGVGGICYVLFGKPVFNVVAGLCLGLVGGGLLGGLGALVALRRDRRTLDGSPGIGVLNGRRR
jgi:hypothetical protein